MVRCDNMLSVIEKTFIGKFKEIEKSFIRVINLG